MGNLRTPKVLFSAEQIEAQVSRLAEKIDGDYKGRSLVAIGVLQGSFVFYADLLRKLKTPLTCEFLALSNYSREPEAGSELSGEVKLVLDIEAPLEGKDLLLIEDLVDTGLTLRFLQRTLSARQPNSLKTCALLRKATAAGMRPPVDYVGFELEESFVVGYGIDAKGCYRGLPYLGTLAKGS